MNLSFEQKLHNYADLIVKVGLGLQPGQGLYINAPIEGAPLVRLIVEKAYQAGSGLVDVDWRDDALTLSRFECATRKTFEQFPTWRVDNLIRAVERGDALLRTSAVDPDLLEDQDPELVALNQRIAEQNMKPYFQKTGNKEFNSSGIALPIAAWAAKVFPDDEPDEQLPKLWEAVLKICRADQSDPIAAWKDHAARLKIKKDYLTAKQYTALKYTAPGTDLTLGLPKNHIWCGGETLTPDGVSYIANIPTEEVFTMPHKDQAEGIVSSAKPLCHNGIVIEDFTLTLAKGRVVKATAKKGESVLKRLLENGEGAARFGEVALVPHSSPISQTGLLFYNGLVDENASCHIALGRAYRCSVQSGTSMTSAEFAAAGGNNSLSHIDFMIGSGEINIDGITGNGKAEPIMRAGEWVF